MKDTLDQSPDLRAEIFLLCDLCLYDAEDGNDRQRLESLLTASEQARDYFVEYIGDSSVLRTLSLASQNADAFDSRPESLVDFGLPLIDGMNASLQSPPQSSADSAIVAILPQFNPSDRSLLPLLTTPRGSFFSRSVLQYVALVALCLYGSFALVAWNLRPDKLPSFAAGSPESVAVVRETTDVEWSKNTSSKLTESSILCGESLKIDSGTIELELHAGTTLVVEGPAEWSIDGNNQAMLRQGKLVARVPHEAIGFMLETPTARVVDLGTEFFATAAANGASTVHVVQGEVAVTSLVAQNSSRAKQNSVRLRQGFGVAIEPDSNSTPQVVASPREVIETAQSIGGQRSSPKSSPAALPSIRFLPELHNTQAKGTYLRLTEPNTLEAEGINYGDQLVNPGSLRLEPDNNAYLDFDCSSTGPLASGGWSEQGRIGKDGSVLYVSWIFRAEEGIKKGWGGVSLLLGGDSSKEEQLFVGKLNNDVIGAADWHDGTYDPRPLNGRRVTSSSVNVELDDKPHRIVMRLRFGKEHAQVAIFLDPAADSTEPDEAELEFTSVGNIKFDRIRFSNGGGQKAWWFDDLRFGRNWSDVITVP
jgi:hypothetical protein